MSEELNVECALTRISLHQDTYLNIICLYRRPGPNVEQLKHAVQLLIHHLTNIASQEANQW